MDGRSVAALLLRVFRNKQWERDMKNVCLIFSLVVSAGLMYTPAAHGQRAQTGQTGQTDQTGQTRQKGQTGTTQGSFLNKAMEMNQAEINLSKMAQNKAENEMVKEYADMMVQDHTQALDELRNAAGGSQSEPSLTKEHQQMSEKLSRLSGDAFDKAYMDAMVRDHQQAIQAFQKVENTGAGSTRQKPGENTKSDADIAREMMPTLQKHLTEAEQIDQNIGGTATIK
jgi:putative membrane protein